ncbi:MAG TPA: hypothetical protein DCM08_05620, partial [Microscillaceae bacterium]|nr:hypothetical protein [Microscillaceae bacterium]
MKMMVNILPRQQRLLQFSLWALLSFFPYIAVLGQHQAPILFDLSDAPTQPSSEPKGLRAINGILYSQAFRGGGSDPDPYRTGTELFFNTDNPAQIFRPGSGSGPFPPNVFSFLDIRPGADDSNPTEFTSFGGRNYFFANPCIGPSCYGQVLFSTNGSSVDVVRIINPTPGSVSGGKNLTRVGSFLCFAASGGAAGEELWRSDGTTVGTQLVLDLNTNFVPPANTLDSYPRDLTAVGSRLFFTANDGTTASSRQLWVYDPTAGTSPGVNPRRVTTGLTFLDIQGSSNNLIAKDGLCFFLADPGGGVALFSTDGT